MKRRFGKYEVVEQIGQGGFGRVYRGFDPVLKRSVAIKTCSFDDPELRKRFVREAEIAARLQHPNVVTVHDFGEEAGEPYLVQEYLEGEDLDALIERGALPDLESRLSVLRQVAEGLGFAHAKGVVHRDVKPGNIRVSPSGRVRIMDFGIAKLLGAEHGLTRTGISVGTAGYLAPEQLQGTEIDRRADIFSFGVVAYELMAGRPPFEGDSVSALFYQIEKVDPTPVTKLMPACPPALADLIHRCLRKDREERPRDFGRVLEALDELEGAAPDRGRSSLARTVRVVAPTAVASDAGVADEGGVASEGGRSLDRGPSPHRAEAGDAAPDSSGRRTRLLLAAAVVGLLVVSGAVALALGGYPGGGGSEAGDAPDLALTVPPREPAEAGDGAVDGEEGEPRDEDELETARSVGTPETEDRSAPSGPAVRERNAERAEVSDRRTPKTDREAAGGPRVEADRRELRDEAPVTSDPGLARGLLVLIQGPSGNGATTVENVLLSELSAEGHAVRDGSALASRPLADPASGQPASLGRRAGTRFVVLGELRSEAAPSVGGFYSGSAVLDLRVYDASTGDLALSETLRAGMDGVPGKLGETPEAARTEVATQVAHQAAAALRRWLLTDPGY